MKITLTTLAAACLASFSQAGLINGTFTNNTNPWKIGPVPGANVQWVQTPGAVVGDGSAVIGPTAAGGSSSIEQPFDCGTIEPDMGCRITWRYMTNMPVFAPNGAVTDGIRITITPMGGMAFSSNEQNTGGEWITFKFERATCGMYTVKFENINGATVTLDTVTDECVKVKVPASPSIAVFATAFVIWAPRRRAIA